MAAYANVIQALHHMNRDLDISIRAEIRGQETETELEKEWHAKHAAAWDEIRKQIDIGEFLYSSDSVQILETLNRETAGPFDGYGDYLGTMQASVEKCLPAIKAAARADLGLPAIKRYKSN